MEVSEEGIRGNQDGEIGKVFDFIILKRYMTNFSAQRNEAIKRAIESDKWRDFLN